VQRQFNLPPVSPAEAHVRDSFSGTILVLKTPVCALLCTRCCRVNPAGTTVLDRPALSLVLNVCSATLRQVFSERGSLHKNHAPFRVDIRPFLGHRLQRPLHQLDRWSRLRGSRRPVILQLDW
jgi:hypothetical protein